MTSSTKRGRSCSGRRSRWRAEVDLGQVGVRVVGRHRALLQPGARLRRSPPPAGAPRSRRARRSSTGRASPRSSARRARSPSPRARRRGRWRCCPGRRTGPPAARRGAGARAGARRARRGRRSSGRSRSRGSRRPARPRSKVERSATCSSARSPRRSRAASIIEADWSTPIDAPVGQARQQRLGDPARAAAGVDDRLAAGQRQALEHLAAHRLHGRGQPVVVGAAPGAGLAHFSPRPTRRAKKRLTRSHSTESTRRMPCTGLAACGCGLGGAGGSCAAGPRTPRRPRRRRRRRRPRRRRPPRRASRAPVAAARLRAAGASAAAGSDVERRLQALREVAHHPLGDVLDHPAAPEARQPAGDREVGDDVDHRLARPPGAAC